MNRSGSELIKSFVQQSLGCRCPDAVFEHIEIDRNIQADNCIFLHSRINIGNQLLIYVIQANDYDVKKYLQDIVNHGKHERDVRGFNRFRLVIATDDKSSEFKQAIQQTFTDLHGIDDKVHLHVVDKKDITFFSPL